ncbi:hypothetical protein Nepgr_011108 [Nepenthes gracilis]|uniref:Uncharacterized protein n=1 Tax=Nepenthes gracilis TaxID=150966 RepID=A0AAD3XLN7_NEPGR|nr:hypothetical protein Nepgr_011108 [Nepenthes gracilis]
MGNSPCIQQFGMRKSGSGFSKWPWALKHENRSTNKAVMTRTNPDHRLEVQCWGRLEVGFLGESYMAPSCWKGSGLEVKKANSIDIYR